MAAWLTYTEAKKVTKKRRRNENEEEDDDDEVMMTRCSWGSNYERIKHGRCAVRQSDDPLCYFE